jgi:septal ring factor EnvC (AmiA/AmiB activator)
MSVPGSSVTLGLAVSVVLAVGGTAGATVLYQGSVQELQEHNDALVTENAQLRERLNETRANLSRAQARVEELREELATRERDIEQLTTELRRTERELNATKARLVELCRQQTEREDCLDRTAAGDG